ncbi:hypothetical protein CJD36_000215 [Flavipsychrobacter stenotrophus]|uniref:TIR domain-containing protein n=1 Tax=Flavipsychrobacter stenotrophus TaxID=2077091 RepID=A0A2S7SZ44_9BACT|nr:toll/interleukin-1 receptor domain-containing protein [Flavipsychrobacter stenotrophus]PQJ12220.1 hypothetical protein CJD36_000215 [Flavipsychrobacter stenotrophus]
MAKAFLSHSSADKNLVEIIAKQLGRNRCHYDSLTFEAGEKSIDEIFTGLESTDVFVLFISDNALNSEWVKKEISQAKHLIDRQKISRIFPLIIDKTITYNDERIPNWIKKPYNIQYFDNQVLILKKITQLLRESDFQKYTHLKNINNSFVGRNNLLGNFEEKLYNAENVIPSCLISYSYFDGIGRRTFLKNAMMKANIIDKWYEPVYIPINSKESIEDFIYKLNFIEKTKEIFKYDFSKETLETKITIAKDLIKKFVSKNEIIFIVDDGGIILPNTIIVPWFYDLLSHEDFYNQVNICLISRYRPNFRQTNDSGKIASFQVDELSPNDIRTLFIQSLHAYDIKLNTDDIKFFLNHLHGIPGQVTYAINLIKSLSLHEAKKLVSDIKELDEYNVLALLDFLSDDTLCIQILIALSKIEIISYDIIYEIFGNNEEVSRSLQKLFDLSLFYNVSSTHEYLKLNTSVSDYINRSQLELENKYNLNLKEFVSKSLQKPLELNENTDYSEFLISLESMIKAKQPIPSKYFIPSFFLKSIVREYYEGNYDTVIDLSNQILQFGNKFDSQIIRETKYWLCSAYCKDHRKGNKDKFFEEIQYFKTQINENEYNNLKDYNFLMGFYYRNSDQMEKAEEYFTKVLSSDPNHSRSKRELVSVYLRQGFYSKALNLAEENFKKSKSNIHHINAYFKCLVRKSDLNSDEKLTLKELLERTAKNVDKRKDEFHTAMSSEYEYFINHKVDVAIADLKETLKTTKRSIHCFKALSDIYRRIDAQDELTKLNRLYPDLAKQH